MDNAMSRPFPGYTLAELEAAVAAGRGTDAMLKEIERRKAVNAGDVSQMTPMEKLRASGDDKMFPFASSRRRTD